MRNKIYYVHLTSIDIALVEGANIKTSTRMMVFHFVCVPHFIDSRVYCTD